MTIRWHKYTISVCRGYTMPPWRHERQETAVTLRKKNLPAAYPVYSTPQRTVQDLRQMNTWGGSYKEEDNMISIRNRCHDKGNRNNRTETMLDLGIRFSVIRPPRNYPKGGLTARQYNTLQSRDFPWSAMPFVPYAARSLSLTGQRRSTAAPFAGNMPTAMATTTTCGPTASKKRCAPSAASNAAASCASPTRQTGGRSFAHPTVNGSTGSTPRKRNPQSFSGPFIAANAASS